MGRLRLSPVSFANDRYRDYVLVMNLLLAACAGAAAAWYLRLGWWSGGIALGLALVLELGLRWRATAYVSIAIGTTFSAAVGAAGGFALAAGLTGVHALWWAAGVLGGALGAAFMLDAHRKLRRARRRARPT